MQSSFMITLALALLAPVGCGFEEDIHAPKLQEVRPASAERADRGTQEESDLPRLTGDRERDKAAVLAALKQTRAAWKEADRAWREASTAKKPDPALVRNLEERSRKLKRRAVRLQELLDQVRQGQPKGKAAPISDLPQLTGDPLKDKALVLNALERARADLKAVRTEYDRYQAARKQPAASVVERLEKRSAEIRARVATLQRMLDALKQ